MGRERRSGERLFYFSGQPSAVSRQVRPALLRIRAVWVAVLFAVIVAVSGDFLQKLLQGISFIPAVVNSIEGLFEGQTGEQKKDSAISFVAAALQMTEAIANREIVDEVKFKDGLGKIVDGTVECLNASIWARKQG